MAIIEGRPITVYGDGTQTRDFVYVKDVARAHMLAASTARSIGKVFNVGAGVEVSINDLMERIEEVTGKKTTVQHKPWPEGDVRREFGDISLAEKTIGYSPETELTEGIRQVVRELQSTGG